MGLPKLYQTENTKYNEYSSGRQRDALYQYTKSIRFDDSEIRTKNTGEVP